MKKLKNVMLLAACGLLVIMTSCKKESGGTPASTKPTISAVTPNSAPIGTEVTITGTNLAGATVSFNGAAATPTSTTATQIKVNVPVGATSGNITVTTSKGSATFAFTVAAPTSPTISAVAPASAGVGTEVTITGTNLTGATVSFNGTAATPTSVTATQIKVNVPTGATTGNITVTTASGAATFAFTVVLPSSDDIAAANRIAKWTFDTDSKESVSNQAASSATGVVYTDAGKIGKCATFTNGYLLYNPIEKINNDTALQSYTISMWVNIPTGANDVLRSLFQVTGNRFPDLWGNVAVELVNNGAATDVLPLQTRQVQVDGLAPYVHNETAGVDVAAGKNKWVFVAVTYDGEGNNQTIKIYADGVLIQTKELTTVDKSPTSTQSTFRVVPTGGSATPTPSNKVYIGTMSFKDRGNDGGDGYGNFAPNAADRPWAGGSLTGKIDDIRVFDIALTQEDITALFTRGSAGN